jgi:hypothetical protein
MNDPIRSAAVGLRSGSHASTKNGGYFVGTNAARERYSAISHNQNRVLKMRILSVCAVLAVSLTAMITSADARGCIKGAFVGGVAGHYAHHHGLAGAAIGCAIGRHEARKHDRERTQAHQPPEN